MEHLPGGEPAAPSLPWVEKYRPKTLEEVVGQEGTVARLIAYRDARQMPHLLFAGPPGTGKTACAVALVRGMFSRDWQDNFLELNASDERGIDVVRENIKSFARVSALGEATFRALFLDEADMLTADAQAALRRTMERFSSTCRFILSVNSSARVIEPLQSRCALFRFRPLPDEAVAKRLRAVAEAEGVEVAKDGLEALVRVAEGDLRRAINSLQGASLLGKRVDGARVYETAAEARPEEVREMVDLALGGKFLKARVLLGALLERGVGGEDLLRRIHRLLVEREVEDGELARLVDRTGEADFRLAQGADERIQLEALLAQMALRKARPQTPE